MPGSHGPRQSGSVTMPTWQASTLASFVSTAGLGPECDGPSDDIAVDEQGSVVGGGTGEFTASHCSDCTPNRHHAHTTSVSETIRQPPLVKAQTALKTK